MSSLRVLFIDDDPRFLRAMIRRLWSRYAITTASGGTEALTILQRIHADAIICNVSMPDMGGVPVYRELQAVSPAVAKRIAFTTGGRLNSEARKLVEEASIPVLRKPFELWQLLALIDELAKGQAPSSSKPPT